MAGFFSIIANEILRATTTEQGSLLPRALRRPLAMLASSAPADDTAGDAATQALVREAVALYRAMSSGRSGEKPATHWLFAADGEQAVHVLPRIQTDEERTTLRDKGNYLQLITMNHPGLAPVLKTAYHQGFPYLVARLRQKMHTLAQEPRADMEPSRAMRITRQVAEALEYAHHRGIIHGALDLDEILIDERGNATLLGIGVDELQRQLQVSRGNLVLSPLTPPEVAQGGAPDARSDVYAVAALLYLLITGKQPVPGRPVNLSKGLTMVPPALDVEMTKALSEDPAKRHKDLVEMNWDLRLAMSTRRDSIARPEAQPKKAESGTRAAAPPSAAPAQPEAGTLDGFPSPLEMPEIDVHVLFEPVPMPEIAPIDQIEIPPPPQIPTVDWNALLQPVEVAQLSSRPIELIETDSSIMDVLDPLQAAAAAAQAMAVELEANSGAPAAAVRPQRRTRPQST